MFKDVDKKFQDEIEVSLGVDEPTGPLAKVSKRIQRAKLIVPSSSNPVDELRTLFQQRQDLIKKSVSFTNACSDREKIDGTGTIPCRLPLDAQILGQELGKKFRKRAGQIEAQMEKQLRQIPIYQHFLGKVFGLGPATAAALICNVNIHRAERPSQLRRFCGLAVFNGRLEHKVAGQKNAYSTEMRTAIYLMFVSLNKLQGQKCNDRPLGTSSKYLKVWLDYKARMSQSERFDAEQNVVLDLDEDGELVPKTRKLAGGKAYNVAALGFFHATGWHKAADVLLEDLYIVWRALEGLPVWPSYYAAKLGYVHLGKICVNAPKLLTLDEALALVGDVGPVAR